MFDIVIPPTVDASTAGHDGTEYLLNSTIESTSERIAGGSPRKIILPRRVGEPRFGPQSYYYEASRTGVVPAGVPQL